MHHKQNYRKTSICILHLMLPLTALTRDWCLEIELWILTKTWWKALHYRQSWALVRVQQAQHHCGSVTGSLICFCRETRLFGLVFFLSQPFLASRRNSLCDAFRTQRPIVKATSCLIALTGIDRSFVVEGEGEPFTCGRFPVEADWGGGCYHF